MVILYPVLLSLLKDTVRGPTLALTFIDKLPVINHGFISYKFTIDLLGLYFTN